MIDFEDLQRLINQKKSFRIGTRGICCDFRYIFRGWRISVPRAFIEIDCDELDILDDEDFYVLGFSTDKGRSFVDFLNLMEYDKLTVIM